MTGHDRLDDDELAALALAADSDLPVAADAVSVWEFLGHETDGPLPAWYMPMPIGSPRLGGWQRRVAQCSVTAVVASFAMINACGLCNTYGQLHL